MAKILVDNRNKHHSRMCTSADGLHVQIGPGAQKIPIDDKFLWKMDPDVVVSRAKVRTFKTAEEEDAGRKAAEEQAEQEATLKAQTEHDEDAEGDKKPALVSNDSPHN